LAKSDYLFLGLLGLLAAGLPCLCTLLLEKDLLEVGEDTARGDGDVTEEFVELLVVADGQGNEAGGDSLLLVVAGGVASELKQLSAHVLHDRGQEDGGTLANTGGETALLQHASNTANGEGETGPLGGDLLLATARFLATRLLATLGAGSGH